MHNVELKTFVTVAPPKGRYAVCNVVSLPVTQNCWPSYVQMPRGNEVPYENRVVVSTLPFQSTRTATRLYVLENALVVAAETPEGALIAPNTA